MTTATYVYCVVASARKPRIPRQLHGLPQAGPIRALAAGNGLFLIVADVPLSHYGETSLEKRLADLEWVSSAAVGHEEVVEAFLSADAVLPMKLFTIFGSDERAVRYVAQTRDSVERLIARVRRKQEWGIRVALDRRPPARSAAAVSQRRKPASSGAGYLQLKKASRDEARDRAQRARAVASTIFEELSAHAAEARRRPATEMPSEGGPLLLDAAFLVSRTGASKLKAAATRRARQLASEGYGVSLTGPWPPYSFMQD